MQCVEADKLCYLFCLVSNMLENYLFNFVCSLSTRGFEIPWFAVCIDRLRQRFETAV